MLTELLQLLANFIYTETPATDSTQINAVVQPLSPSSGITVPSAKIIDILPDAMYKFSDADEPTDGSTLKNQRLMQKDYTKKTQDLSAREKVYQQQLAQREQEVEKLKNQLLSLNLGNKFQQQSQVSGRQPQPVVTTDNQDGNDYDWLYNQNAAPNTQTQSGLVSNPLNSGINSTPMNLEQLADLLSQHPKFNQPVQEKIVTDIQTLFNQERERNRQQTEELERNLQFEAEYKKQYGQRGVDLLYAMESAKNEGNVSRWFELQTEEKKLIAQKAVAEAKEAEKMAQEEAVEAARSAPLVIPGMSNDGETKLQRDRRVKSEAIKRATALHGSVR